jgi:hypothetical protein
MRKHSRAPRAPVRIGRVLIGIVSDTHDRAETMALAVRMLRERGAEFFIHCGDVGSPRVLDHLAGLAACFVFGNCDWDRAGLKRYAAHIDLACHDAFGDLTLDGKRIAVIHGDDSALKRRLLAEQQHDYLLQGHSHLREDTRIGRMRLINPGALHRANPKTAALLDTGSDELAFLVVA